MNLGLLDTEPEERFDNITNEAIKIFNVPISTISLLDKDREWFKSSIGLDNREGPRNTSFCGHAIYAKIIFIVEDTLTDLRFKDNPTVINPPKIRFYAGVALYDKTGNYPIGVLCIKDIKPRKFTPADIDKLVELAKKAEQELNRTYN
ncbi:MAG: GAF domain-containing protein [Patescibacteria group bacterium]